MQSSSLKMLTMPKAETISATKLPKPQHAIPQDGLFKVQSFKCFPGYAKDLEKGCWDRGAGLQLKPSKSQQNCGHDAPKFDGGAWFQCFCSVSARHMPWGFRFSCLWMSGSIGADFLFQCCFSWHLELRLQKSVPYGFMVHAVSLPGLDH